MWNSLVPPCDSSGLTVLCVRLISVITAVIYWMIHQVPHSWCRYSRPIDELKQRIAPVKVCRWVRLSSSAPLPHFLLTWHGVAQNLTPATPGPALIVSSPPLLCKCLRGEVCVRDLRETAREWAMSQMNTCQVMSSPVSADDRTQLFGHTEPQS